MEEQREGLTAARKRVQDRIVLGAILFPIGWVGATVLYGWSAMLRLGRWPVPNQDDPAQVFGSTFHNAALFLFVGSGGIGVVLFLSAVRLAPKVVVTAARHPDMRAEAWRLGWLLVTYLLAGIYIRTDPAGVLVWMGD